MATPPGDPGEHLVLPSPRPPCYYFFTLFFITFPTTRSLQVAPCCPTRRCPRDSGSADLKGLRPLPPTPRKNLDGARHVLKNLSLKGGFSVVDFLNLSGCIFWVTQLSQVEAPMLHRSPWSSQIEAPMLHRSPLLSQVEAPMLHRSPTSSQIELPWSISQAKLPFQKLPGPE